MHVNTRKLAVSGLLMAFDVVLIILSGIIDFNTLFLLAAAAFLVGVIIREFDLKYGLAFFVGSLVLGVLLAPQKLYCITYAMMGIYVLGVEFLWDFLGKHPGWKSRKILLIFMEKYMGRENSKLKNMVFVLSASMMRNLAQVWSNPFWKVKSLTNTMH